MQLLPLIEELERHLTRLTLMKCLLKL